eukprot:4702-Heterococcus_DN1.PRE.10
MSCSTLCALSCEAPWLRTKSTALTQVRCHPGYRRRSQADALAQDLEVVVLERSFRDGHRSIVNGSGKS